MIDDIKKRILEKHNNKVYKVDDNLDDVVDFSIETALNDVLSYCNLEVEDYSKTLDNTVLLIAIDLLNETGLTLTDEQKADNSIKSLTEGDFTIARETRAEVYQKMASAPSFCKKYTRILNRYRKLSR